MADNNASQNLPVYHAITNIALIILWFCLCFVFDTRTARGVGALLGILWTVHFLFLLIKYGKMTVKKEEPACFPTDENRKIFLKGQYSSRSINEVKNILAVAVLTSILYAICIISHSSKMSGFFAECFLVYIPFCVGSMSLCASILFIVAFIKGNTFSVEISDMGIRNGNKWFAWQDIRKVQTERFFPWGPLRIVVYPQKANPCILAVDEKINDDRIKQILNELKIFVKKES